VYGFLRDVQDLMERFNTEDLIFCFDVGFNKRKIMYPEYKSGRESETPTQEEVDAKREFLRQLKLLRKEYLPAIGFRNIKWQKGHESDDVIASLVRHSFKKDDRIYIVSADKDFRQLITGNVSLYDPVRFKHTTLQTFHREYGIRPIQWADVLELSGCRTDKVPGIKGIGDKTAIKYLRNELKSDSKAYKAIASGKKHVKWARTLVRLPLYGTKRFTVRKNRPLKWGKVFASLGIKSLNKSGPKMKAHGGFGL
jgi:DNA polymerase-1